MSNQPEKPLGGEVYPFPSRDRHGVANQPADRAVTLLAMLERGWEFRVYCTRCNTQRLVDLQRLVQKGQGNRSVLGRRLICTGCGKEGHGQIREPIHRS
jgi:hypothetical protein